jgi:rRNA processing protein Gar1
MKGERVVVLGDVVRRFRDSILVVSKEPLPIGTKVYSERGEVGYVSDVFGPKDGVYVLVRLEGDQPLGKRLYAVLARTEKGKARQQEEARPQSRRGTTFYGR